MEQESIQKLVKARKAPEWNYSSAWEWIERRIQETIGTWAKCNPSTGSEGWTNKTITNIEEWGPKFGLDNGLCINIQITLQENCHNPTQTSNRYLEHLLGEIRNKRKGAEEDIRKGQTKEWRDKVEKWVDSNSKEAYNLMKMGEEGNVHHSVSMGRIPNILEEVDEAEKVWGVGGTRRGVGTCRNASKNMRAR